jgi:hypothetical protein
MRELSKAEKQKMDQDKQNEVNIIVNMMKKYPAIANMGDIFYAISIALEYHNPSPCCWYRGKGTHLWVNVEPYEAKFKNPFNYMSGQDLVDAGVIQYHTNIGNFNTKDTRNPLTGRKVEGTPCIRPDFFDKYKDIMYEIHSQSGDCSRSKQDWIQKMQNDYYGSYGYYPVKGKKFRYIGDSFQYKGVKGKLVKETRTLYHLLNAKGIHRVKK